MSDALGIINFENQAVHIDGMDNYRPLSAISFMGRYRIIDFMMSNMTNSGISRIQVYVSNKPRSLFEHLGTGLHYNINSKRGKLQILYGEKNFSSPVYNTDVANFMVNLHHIEEDANPYVIIAPSYFIYSLDFNEVLKNHLDSKADVTVLYTNTDMAKSSFLGCDVLTMDKDRRITDFDINRGKTKNRQVSMECYVMQRKLFIELIKKATETSSLYWFKDILADNTEELDIRGYNVRGYVACINSIAEYFRISMELRHRKTAIQLFKPDWPIYTITNDSCPTRYTQKAKVVGSVVANGCVIEGNVTDCILGRNVTVQEGARVQNSILLPGAYIGKGAKLDHVIVDKSAIVHHIKELKGTDLDPVYVKRRDRI